MTTRMDVTATLKPHRREAFVGALPETGAALADLPVQLRAVLTAVAPAQIADPLDRYVFFAAPDLREATMAWYRARGPARRRRALVSIRNKGERRRLDRELSSRVRAFVKSQGPDPVLLAVGAPMFLRQAVRLPRYGLEVVRLRGMAYVLEAMRLYWRPLLLLSKESRPLGHPAFDPAVALAGFTMIADDGPVQRVGSWELCPLMDREDLDIALDRAVAARAARWKLGELGFREG